MKNDYICMTVGNIEIINGELVPSKTREVKIPINDILVANGFEPIKENNVENNRHKSKILSKYINIMN